MKPHANSHENDALHHLYELYDVERDAIYKFGISGQSLNQDGSSPRANEQVNLFNRVVGMIRFFARILQTNIPGRKRAEEIEQEHIDTYQKKYGHKPPGNL